jgi:hypothetical protein
VNSNVFFKTTNFLRIKKLTLKNTWLTFKTKEGTNFALPINGFLFLTSELPINYNELNVCNYKKMNFSFTLKNELKRFVLKKYLKQRFNYIVSNSSLATQTIFLNTNVANELNESLLPNAITNDIFTRNNFFFFNTINKTFK